jgi:hypothetical protein
VVCDVVDGVRRRERRGNAAVQTTRSICLISICLFFYGLIVRIAFTVFTLVKADMSAVSLLVTVLVEI